MRRPVICTPRLAVEFLESAAAERGTRFEIELNHAEGTLVGAGDPIFYVTGPLYHLVDLETVLLQKLGPACVAAYNAYAMCADLPKVAFMAMDARHCAGAEMADDDGLRRLGRVGGGAARGGRHRLRRLRRRRDRPLFRPGKGPRHDAARADRLCRLDGARGRDVPRGLPGGAADRAGRLFRAARSPTRSRWRGAFPSSPPQAGSRCGSIPLAAAIARGSTRPGRMR